jgi:hypothetical protein
MIIRGRDPDVPLSEVDEYRYDVYVVAELDLWDEMLLRNEDRLLDTERLLSAVKQRLGSVQIDGYENLKS